MFAYIPCNIPQVPPFSLSQDTALSLTDQHSQIVGLASENINVLLIKQIINCLFIIIRGLSIFMDFEDTNQIMKFRIQRIFVTIWRSVLGTKFSEICQ